ncbi:DUF4880 domain-containing protein [Azoarcus indigens]|uniref:FecR family protein n=1 Tax=Azoarcus indigens TaxID=29545 RepID=A0A4V6PQI1_9RHOO|nr:FecR family protein [Azoarcus indigens]NMG65971.1 DUF4880 domain-containing protein [Azoarcus indigens]TDN46862.1 FecR family protein [Azoarcus indigens]
MPRSDTVPPQADPAAAQAIAWAVRLRSGEAGEAERAAFRAWRQADPRHEAAAARLEQSLGLFDSLPGEAAARSGLRRALLAPANRRRMLRDTLGLLLLGAGSGALVHRQMPVNDLFADLHTGTGERRRYTLADGSQLWLNARSAADLAFDASQRRLQLRSGELIVEVARDPARPFVVETAEGSVRALGTRFLVRQEAGSTLVAVLHSRVALEPQAAAGSVLAEGASARFDRRAVYPESQAPRGIAAWEDGFIEVHDRPLADVIAALRPYRSGVLRVAPEAAGLRVTGTFPLDDSERTLAALAEALPIAVRRRTDYWVWIEAR